MNLYLLEFGTKWEGDTSYGIFPTIEAANEAAEDYLAKNGWFVYDYYHVVEFRLGEFGNGETFAGRVKGTHRDG